MDRQFSVFIIKSRNMADQKITELDELDEEPNGDDVLIVIDDTIGTPATKKVTIANLREYLRE